MIGARSFHNRYHPGRVVRGRFGGTAPLEHTTGPEEMVFLRRTIPQGRAEASRTCTRPGYKTGEILVVGRPVTIEKVQEHESGEPDAILRRALNLSLILIVNLAIHQLR